MSVIRSLDLGSGWTKLNRIVNGKLEYMSFPSLAPRHTGRDLSGSVLSKRDTVVVTVEGTAYEVGPDAGDIDSNDSSRNLNDQYIYSDQYRAVMFGALNYMGEKTIDLLVVGLPLTTFHRADDLRKLTLGTHKVSDSLTVEVKDVMVVPQPLGGLFYCLSQADQRPEFEFLREETNLIIDIGYLTYDFVVAKGDKINDSRSGAHPGGVAKTLRSVCDSISTKFDIKYDNLALVDAAIARRRIKINGKVEDLTEHIRFAKPSIDGSISYMRNIAGDGSDIDNIILLGGGQSIFARTLLGQYKQHKILVLPDSQFANVKGYQAAGEKHLKAKPSAPTDEKLEPLQVLSYEAPAANADAPAAAASDI